MIIIVYIIQGVLAVCHNNFVCIIGRWKGIHHQWKKLKFLSNQTTDILSWYDMISMGFLIQGHWLLCQQGSFRNLMCLVTNKRIRYCAVLNGLNISLLIWIFYRALAVFHDQYFQKV